jgi:hypothetical protein
MATPEGTVTSTGNDVIFPEVEYAKYNTSHGSYQLTQIIQQTGGQTINGGLTLNGGQETIFELPPKVYNFAQSILRYKITPTAGGASNYNNVWNDCVPELRIVQLYTRSGLYLCDIQDMNNYTNCILRSTTKLEEMLSNDVANPASSAGNGSPATWEGLQQCSQAMTTGLTGEDTGDAVSELLDPFIPQLCVASTSVVTIDKLTTPNYTNQSGGTNAATPVYTRQFPLSVFRNTVLSMDKDLYFGGETLYLRMVWAPLTKIMFVNTSNTNPATGVGNAVTGAAVSNLTLFAAVEQNQVIQNSLMNKVNSGTFSILVPYVFQNKLNLQGTTQTVNVRYNRAHGQRLHKIYIAPYNNSETNLTAYDHTNVQGSKVSSFYSTVNNVRTTQFNPTAATYDEYMLLGKRLKGSCIQSAVDYYNNYFWLEDFTNNTPMFAKPISPPEVNQSDGMSLDQEIIYSLYANTTNANYNWYIWAITERVLSVAPGAISLN